MLDAPIERIAQFVSQHNRVVLLIALLATAGVVAGIPQLEAQQQQSIDDGLETQSDVAAAGDYIDERYALGDDEGPPTATSVVYVRDEGGNALSRTTLLEALEYQEAARQHDAVADGLAEDGMTGPPNLVATRLAGDPDADLAEQRAALEAASDEEVAAVVEETFQGEAAGAFLPSSYEPGTAEAESFRLVWEFELDEAAADDPLASAPEDAQRGLYEAAEQRDDPEFFTVGEFASESYNDQYQSDTIWLVLVPALVVVLGVLAFAYRDLADVVIGFVGVLLSVLWMFGILGWLGIPAGFALIIGPVLIVALSIDFGLHVFMRYRERRASDDADHGIRPAMGQATAGVTVAFLLVTVTAAIGFLSNLTSPLGIIRDLGVAITLGVLSSFVIFTTLVPALKISVDGLLERLGLDRRKAPLGNGQVLRPVLESGVSLARRGAPAVIVLALLVGTVGGLAYADLDRQGFQNPDGVADWKTELPGPMAWEASEMEYAQHTDYVDEQYQSGDDARSTTRFLVEGDPTDPETVERVAAGEAAAQDNDATYSQGGEVQVLSALSVMETVAAQDEAFAAVYEDADTDGDGVPDRNVAAVYDALYETAPEQAARVVERTDEGEYESLLVHVPVEQGLDVGDQGEAMHDLADEMESDGVTVTPVGVATLNNAELAVLADGILQTMLIALAAITLALVVVYRLERGSALLGAITVVPIALVVGMVFGAMYVFGVPLTFVTALLMSVTVGLGVDYNIHVSDRFVQELDEGATPVAALTAAVTGTGGALLGSALTSGAAFAMLMLHPEPQLQSFGAIVVLALSLSFLLSVFVLPSLLYVWATRVRGLEAPATPTAVPSDD